MIRQGRFVDIPRLTELVGEMHARSRYATISGLDEKAVRSILTQVIQRDGGAASGATRVEVAVQSDRVEGFIIGVLAPLYEVGTALLCTDWMFYASERCAARDAPMLLDRVIQWADANPRVKVQRYGVTDAMGDPARAGKLYERRGFRPAGTIWERESSAAMEIAA